MTLSVTLTESDGVTPFSAEAFGELESGTTATKAWKLNVSGGAIAGGGLRLIVKQTSGSYVQPDATVSNGRYFRARVTTTGLETDWFILWGGQDLPLPPIADGDSIDGELEWAPPGGTGALTENDDFRLAYVPRPNGVPLVNVLGYEGDAILSGIGVAGVTEWVVAGAATASGTPDDVVHLAAGSALFNGAPTATTSGTVTLDQNDVAPAALGSGEEYKALVYYDAAGALQSIKGAKATAGDSVPPALPVGGLLHSRVTVAYNSGGSAIDQGSIHQFALSGRCLVTLATGLNVNVGPGRLRLMAGGVVIVAPQLVSLADDATNRIWIESNGVATATATASPPSVGAFLRATVVTASGVASAPTHYGFVWDQTALVSATGNALQIQGRDVAATAPATDEVLKWDGSQWVPGAGGGGGSGDATSLQGRALAASAPATNDVVKWNGSQWGPAAESTGGGGSTLVVHPTPGATMDLDCSLAAGGADIIFDWTAGEDETVNAINLTDGQLVTFRIHETSAIYRISFGSGIWTSGFQTQGSFDNYNNVNEVNFITADDSGLYLMPLVSAGPAACVFDLSGVSGTVTLPPSAGGVDTPMLWMISLNGDTTISMMTGTALSNGKVVKFLVQANNTTDYTVSFGFASYSEKIPAGSGSHAFTFVLARTGWIRWHEGPVTVHPTPGATVSLDCSLLPASGGVFEWTPGEDELVQATNVRNGQVITIRLICDGSSHIITPDSTTGFPALWTVAQGPASFDLAPLTNWDTGSATEFRFRAVSGALQPMGPDASSLWGFTPEHWGYLGTASDAPDVFVKNFSAKVNVLTPAASVSLTENFALELTPNQATELTHAYTPIAVGSRGPGSTIRERTLIIIDDGTARAITFAAGKFIGTTGFSTAGVAGQHYMLIFKLDQGTGLLVQTTATIGPY